MRSGTAPLSPKESRSSAARSRAAPSAFTSCRRPIAAVARRGGESRRYRLAADPGALQRAETDVGQPDGHAQSRDRGGDGPRRARGSALAAGARRRSETGDALSVCLPCAPTCWKWLATCRARFSNMLRPRSGRRASRSGTTSWRRRPGCASERVPERLGIGRGVRG